MSILYNRRENSVVAVYPADEILLESTQDALDLLGNAGMQDCHKLLLPKQAVVEAFFDLRTGLAGEVLQKFTNYGVCAAFVGDFSGYESRALRDFIRESNKGGRIFFLPTQQQALDALHSAKG